MIWIVVFRVLTICLLLVYFVSAAGCHVKKNGLKQSEIVGLSEYFLYFK